MEPWNKTAAAAFKKKRTQLFADYLRMDATDFLQRHAGLLDEYFRDSFADSHVGPEIGIVRNPYAIVALGGYGREEQCRHSDVDLLILFQKQVPKKAEQLVREIIYPLWDLGLDIGYATRSLKESVQLSGRDYEILTPLLDARFVCGVSIIFSDLMEQVQKKIVHRNTKKIITWLIERNRKRHLQFGDSAFLLEPNLKEGRGGLRDYHTMRWIARVTEGVKNPRDLEYYGFLSHVEYQHLTEALDFIWQVRNRLHHLTGRKTDQLHFEAQVRLARSMKFHKQSGQQGVERFLSELHRQMEFIEGQHQTFLREQGYAVFRNRLRIRAKNSRVPGIAVKRSTLHFDSLENILKDPMLLLKIFQESARLHLPLSAEAKRVVREFDYLMDESFLSSAAVRRSFEKTMAFPATPFSVLQEMLAAGFLTRYIPEFKKISDRIQYNAYHLYPVDKHSLRVVQTLKQLTSEPLKNGDELAVRLYREIKNKNLLLWAALLHDIGKGTPGNDHSSRGAEIARNILASRGLKFKEIEMVSFLVAHHLTLIKTATRRDINDEETIIHCARRIKDADRLKMLYLLTVADSMATGPKAWNEWTATLLRDLFLKTIHILEKGELASAKAVESVNSKILKILASPTGEKDREALQEILGLMSPRYLLYVPENQIQEDIALYRSLGKKDFVWEIHRSEEEGTRTVRICARDRAGLLSQIAGVFTLSNLDILDVQVFTWKNDIALDVFRVKPPADQIFESEKWAQTAKRLQRKLDGKIDLDRQLFEKIQTSQRLVPSSSENTPKVRIDNEESSFYNIVEIIADDFPGLLYRVTHALYQCGLDLRTAIISTRIDQVMDVFYVRDLQGQKIIDADRLRRIEAGLTAVLSRKATVPNQNDTVWQAASQPRNEKQNHDKKENV